MKGIVILTDGSIQPFNGGAQDIHNAVGGWIEGVPTMTNQVSMYCCEEGKLLNYPLNRRATFLWAFLGGSMHVLAGDQLVGNVVVVGGVDAEGEDTDLDPELEARLRWVMEQMA